MSDYISRETLIGKMEKHYCAPCKEQGGDLGGDWCRFCVTNSVLEKVRGIPAADVAPVVHGELTEHIRELLRAEQDGRLVVLPCRVGDRIYRVIDDCTFPGDCGTKRMCKGCEYRNLFIEQTTFRLYLLTDDGKLRRGYYRTREEAETALEGNNG